MLPRPKRVPPLILVSSLSGPGSRITRGLAERGATILLGSTDLAADAATIAPLRAAGLAVSLEPLDMSDPDSITSLATRLNHTHGSLDGLVHAAPMPGILIDSLITSVVGAAHLTEALSPLLAASGRGRVVFLSSAAASVTAPPAGQDAAPPSVQVAATALNALTRSYAASLAPQGIKVNAVCPAGRAQAAIHMALLDDDGPTGSFTDDAGELPW